MERLPRDCLTIICNLINDKDYVNFTSISKYFRSLIKHNVKIMTNQHKLSKIIKVKNIFVFTNILYDYKNFDVTKIPHTITEITFCDEFNETFDKLCKFKYLTKINIGMYYHKSLCDNMHNITNIKEIAIIIITNSVFANLFHCNPRYLYANINSGDFLNRFKTTYDIIYNRYITLQTRIKNNLAYQIDFVLLRSINMNIDVTNEYELCYFKNNILEISEDYENYMSFLTFHIDKVLEYLTKLKFTVCENHEKIRRKFVASGDKQMILLKK